MKIYDLLIMIMRNLFRRKVRTMLTVVGVIIGTCSIVVMISLGIGMTAQFDEYYSNMTDLTRIEVYGGGMYISGPGQSKPQAGTTLNDATLEKFSKIKGVKAVTPYQYFWYCEIIAKKYQLSGGVIAVNLDALPYMGFSLGEGRYPTEAEKESAVIFGGQAAYNFINTSKRINNMVSPWPDQNGVVKEPFVDPLKAKMIIRAQYYGEAEKKRVEYDIKATGKFAYDMQKGYDMSVGNVFIDLALAKKLLKDYNKLNDTKESLDKGYDQVYVIANSVDEVEAVEKEIADEGFNTWSFASMRKSMQEQSQTIQLTFGGIGGISLLVAAIGIANTMIMSIYERTREIGIMKVLGCPVGNIRTVFLGEAALIGVIGGVFGIGISYGISYLLNTLAIASQIPIWLIFLGLGFAFLVGIVAGFYPANRAVRISALEAIRHE